MRARLAGGSGESRPPQGDEVRPVPGDVAARQTHPATRGANLVSCRTDVEARKLHIGDHTRVVVVRDDVGRMHRAIRGKPAAVVGRHAIRDAKSSDPGTKDIVGQNEAAGDEGTVPEQRIEESRQRESADSSVADHVHAVIAAESRGDDRSKLGRRAGHGAFRSTQDGHTAFTHRDRVSVEIESAASVYGDGGALDALVLPRAVHVGVENQCLASGYDVAALGRERHIRVVGEAEHSQNENGKPQ